MKREARAALVCSLLAVGPAGCDDATGIGWNVVPKRGSLYSLHHPDLNRPSAFDMVFGEPVVVEAPEATGTWDFFLGTEGDELVIGAPPVIGIESEAAIAEIPTVGFGEVRAAPSDSAAYRTHEVFFLRREHVYVIRTRATVDLYGVVCQYYGKLQPLLIDRERGSATFIWDLNPNCYDGRLTGSAGW